MSPESLANTTSLPFFFFESGGVGEVFARYLFVSPLISSECVFFFSTERDVETRRYLDKTCRSNELPESPLSPLFRLLCRNATDWIRINEGFRKKKRTVQRTPVSGLVTHCWSERAEEEKLWLE